MWDLLIGNGISLIASIFLAISSCARERKNIYLFQILETGTYCVSSVFFKSWSGLSTLILSLIRNILVYTKHFREWHAYLFSVLVVVVGLMVNNRGFLGLLPLIATVELTLANYYARRVVFIKASLWINTVIWMIYSYLIFDFVAGIMQTVISVLGLISLLQCIRNNG